MHPLSLLWNQTQDMTLNFLRSLQLIDGYATKSQAVPSTTLEQSWSLIPGYPANLQFTSYIMLHCWFVVMKLQGLFAPVSPSKIWQPARVDKSTRATKSRPNQKPPEIILKHVLLLLFIAYCMTVKATTHRVRARSMEMHQLCILSLTFISVALLNESGSTTKCLCPNSNRRTTHQCLAHPYQLPLRHPKTHAPNMRTSIYLDF